MESMDRPSVNAARRGAWLVALLVLAASLGCSRNTGPARQKTPDPKEQFDFILSDLKRGLGPVFWASSTANVRTRQEITGEIVEPENEADPLTANITVVMQVTVDVLRQSPPEDEEAASGSSSPSGNPLAELEELDALNDSDPFVIGEPNAGDLPGPKPSLPAPRDPITRDDELREEISLTYSYAEQQWILTGEPKLKSVQIAVKHALAFQ